MDERNKFLTEAMGECWHEDFGYLLICSCGEDIAKAPCPYLPNNDFSTPEGFFKLWEWAQKQKWWKAFIWEHGARETSNCLPEGIIPPDRFADAVYEFLKDIIREE